VIRGLDLEIPPGRITARLGANGAGKSSLVLAIAGSLPASAGAIFVDGKPIAGMRPEAVRRLGVAAVPEGHHVLGDLSVLDKSEGRRPPFARRAARTGYRSRADDFPRTARKTSGARRIALG